MSRGGWQPPSFTQMVAHIHYLCAKLLALRPFLTLAPTHCAATPFPHLHILPGALTFQQCALLGMRCAAQRWCSQRCCATCPSSTQLSSPPTLPTTPTHPPTALTRSGQPGWRSWAMSSSPRPARGGPQRGMQCGSRPLAAAQSHACSPAPRPRQQQKPRHPREGRASPRQHGGGGPRYSNTSFY